MLLASIVVLGETLYRSTLLLTKNKGLKSIASTVIIRKKQKEEQIKHNFSKRKRKINIRVETDKTENRKFIEEINETKSGALKILLILINL